MTNSKVNPDKGNRTGGAPTDKRGCRDIIFLILFVISWAGMAFVAYFAFSFGDVNKI